MNKQPSKEKIIGNLEFLLRQYTELSSQQQEIVDSAIGYRLGQLKEIDLRAYTQYQKRWTRVTEE